MRRTVYVTAERLAAELRWQKPPVLLDVRWSLANPDGRAAFAANHLPGAQYVDLETELSGKVGADTGRHPLPEIADLQRAARRWGINDGDAVVCYDDSDGAGAARAWWVLKWAGVENVRILDGGYRAWAGHGIIVSDRYESGRPKRKGRRPRGNVTLSAGHLPTISAQEAAHFPGVLLDARAPMRYRGEFEPLDPRAGHIPGATNAPYTANLTPAGTIRPEQELQNRFHALGALNDDPVAVYCGSGVTAAHNVAALASLGVEAALYPGSWSQWSSDPRRPAEVGEGR